MNTTTKKSFIQELERSLPSTINKTEIVKEWEQHIDEALQGESEELVISRRLGDPVEIAHAYKINTAQMEWVIPFFIGSNCLFFIFGSLLTLAYHVTDFAFADLIWLNLVEVAPLIILALK
jgi:uncharacterized membrane protein